MICTARQRKEKKHKGKREGLREKEEDGGRREMIKNRTKAMSTKNTRFYRVMSTRIVLME